MRLIVKESQYKSIIREQQSRNKMVDQWSTFIMDKMLLNIPLSTEEIISETQLNRKIYRNNFYKKLPINNITINTIKGKDKNYDFEIELKDDIIENLFLDIQIPYNEEIKLEDIKNIFNSVTNKRFKLLDEQWIKGVDLGELEGEVGSTQAMFKAMFDKELKVIDINDGEIIFDKSNVDDGEWEKITQWAQEAFSKENYPEGGHVSDTDYNSITFDTTPDDKVVITPDEDDDKVVITPDEDEDKVVITPDTEEGYVKLDDDRLYTPRSTGNYFGKGKNGPHYGRKGHSGHDYVTGKPIELVWLKGGIVRSAHFEGTPKCSGRGKKNACGGTITIKVGDGRIMIFCHMSEIFVKKDEKLYPGRILGLTGGARGQKGRGCSTGPHLHTGMKVNGRYNDPHGYEGKDYKFLKPL
tara:strand:- start:7455 stop:8687 length:1233 start_codon:yes stop_codon:yes gene_type:complete